MIKKRLNKYIKVNIVLLLLMLYITGPVSVKAASTATTLAELRAELKALQKKKADNESQKQYTQSQINQKNQDISNAYTEIEKSETQIAEAKKTIEDTQVRISELNQQTEELMAYYQIMTSDNSYLEFITDSSSMTEMIMRIDAVDHLVNSNREKLIEAEDLIKSNEQQQVDLKNYEKKLNQNIESYKNKIDELDSSLLQMSDIAVDINEEIKMVQTSIKTYEEMGCKENEKFDVCATKVNNTGWLKPLTKGKITSLFGWRTLNGSASNHSGIDIGITEGTNVYSATAGKVVYITRKGSCGGNQVYIESVVNGTTYTVQYAHLLSISVSLGDTVTNQTVIGKSGGYSTAKKYGGYDSCTFGAHLHFGVSKSRFTSWTNYYANLINPPGFPGKGSWFYSRTQWFG